MTKVTELRRILGIKADVVDSPKAIDLITSKVYAKHVLKRKEGAREILNIVQLSTHTSCSSSLGYPGGAVDDSVSKDLHSSLRISVKLLSNAFERSSVEDFATAAIGCCYLSGLVDKLEFVKQ